MGGFEVVEIRMPSLDKRKALDRKVLDGKVPDRKLQNREAQRRFRKKKQQMEHELAVRNEELIKENAQLEREKIVVQPSQKVELSSIDLDPNENISSQ
jgi:hypothetical protein